MTKPSTLVLLFFLAFAVTASAQTGVGCLIGTTTNGTLYLQQDFFGIYQTTGSQYPVSPPNCPRVQLGSVAGSCQTAYFGTVRVAYNYTVITTSSSPVACSMDDHIMVLVGGIMGFFLLRRQHKAHPVMIG